MRAITLLLASVLQQACASALHPVRHTRDSSTRKQLTEDVSPIIDSALETQDLFSIDDEEKIQQQQGIDYRIVGGEELEQVPRWMASIRRPLRGDKNNMEHFCGGTIISDVWVLTAAHCISRAMVLDYQVWLDGVNQLNSMEFEKYSVVDYIVHPNWDQATAQNDIALLKLDRSSLDGRNSTCGARQPVVLRQTFDIAEGTMMEIIGWGVTDEVNKVMPEVIRTAKVPAVTDQDCSARYMNGITENQFCAGYSTGKIDACSGDSGGPIFNRQNDFDVQYGIISWGIGCARVGRYGVYTRVAAYISWIQEQGVTLSDGSPQPGAVSASAAKGLSDFFVSVPSVADSKIEPVAYFGFQCGFSCPDRKTVASFQGVSAPLACILRSSRNIPTSVVANMTVRVSDTNETFNVNVDMLTDQRVTCRPAKEFCDEMEFVAKDGGTCRGPLSTDGPARTICRVRLASIIPALEGRTIAAFTVMASVLADNTRTLQDMSYDVRGSTAPTWGLWKANRPIIRTVVSGTVGLSNRPTNSQIRYNSSSIKVTEVDQSAGLLKGTFEDVEAGTGTNVNGEFWCAKSMSSNANISSYDCTFAVRTPPPPPPPPATNDPNALPAATTPTPNPNVPDSLELVTISIGRSVDDSPIMTVSRNIGTRDGAGGMKVILSSGVYTPSQVAASVPPLLPKGPVGRRNETRSARDYSML